MLESHGQNVQPRASWIICQQRQLRRWKVQQRQCSGLGWCCIHLVGHHVAWCGMCVGVRGGEGRGARQTEQVRADGEWLGSRWEGVRESGQTGVTVSHTVCVCVCHSV